ncbi:MAG: SAM-dependent methyltransferase [Acidimicrobiia bacterium]|nr:SAM-dependent methyltransferase [Acidimicrobiia bacterium]
MLARRLADRIREQGPLPFDEFMQAALYDPDEGYFASGPLRSSREGDFLTSPEVSPLFGATLARFVEAEAARIGADPITVVDAGAGSGSLLRALLDAARVGIRAWAVEVSPAAREALRLFVPEATVVEKAASMAGPIQGVVLANELLDNLPAGVAVRRGAGWVERLVGAGPGGLCWEEGPARPEVAAWAERHAGPVPEGGLVETQIAAGEWLRGSLRRLAAGSVVVIDYGDTGANLARRRPEGTLRTYRHHHLGPDPLADPGGTDITVDVDFGALAAAAGAEGAAVEVTSQAVFLERWGLGDLLAGRRAEELALARDGDPMERLRVRSLITGGEALLHPRGLGDFRVLVARR